jgi:hypothetical protein
MEFTVIGDAVDFSWELEEMTKHPCDIIFELEHCRPCC